MEHAMQLSRQKLEELVAVLSIYGDRLAEVSPPEWLQAAQAICDGHATAADAFATAHAGQSCAGVLLMSGECSSTQEPLAASLAFTMPPGYPGASAPLQCHVTAPQLRRQCVDELSEQLQQQATAAQGRECLFELAEALQEELHTLAEQQAAQQSTAQQQQQQQETQGYRRVLLHLDHMRDRAGYTAIIKQWACELQLTGWLLFWQSLILIFLEGSSRNISTYLKYARTTCVDVDSCGRKCRERMLTILEGSSTPGLVAACNSSRGRACGHNKAGGAHEWDSCCATREFREVQAGSLEDVVVQLAAVQSGLDTEALRKLVGVR